MRAMKKILVTVEIADNNIGILFRAGKFAKECEINSL